MHTIKFTTVDFRFKIYKEMQQTEKNKEIANYVNISIESSYA